MRKKNYFQPTMKLHELKAGRVLDTISRVDTKTGGSPDLEDYETVTETDVWGSSN